MGCGGVWGTVVASTLGFPWMLEAIDRWGPWRDGIDPSERTARLRGLRATARLLAGPRAAPLCRLLLTAETDPAALEPAARALAALPASDRRQIWAAYAALDRAA